MPSPALALAPHVYRIPTVRFDLVNTFAFVEDDGSVTLVDCGLEKAPPRIVAGLAAIGKAPADVQRIVLTHAHLDHAGGARALVERTAADGVTIHADDAQAARTGIAAPIDRSTTTGRILARRTDGKRAFEPVQVAHELADGEVLPVAGGLRVVHTPGHSPGHASLLHEPSGVLITGDAIFNVLRLRWPVKAFCTDVAMTQRTAGVLGDLEYTTAAFTHGPHVADHARERVRAFLAAARRTGDGA
jgi:glyoxylase-like metal-dependent hydrolase (beta-lactamase superfamily II)